MPISTRTAEVPMPSWQAGTRMLLQPEDTSGSGHEFPARLLSAQEGQQLIVSTPASAQQLPAGLTLTGRMLAGLQVLSFSCQLLGQDTQAGTLTLAWPAHLQTRQLRNSLRIATHLTAKVGSSGHQSVFVSNLSSHGAQLEDSPHAMADGDEVLLHLPLKVAGMRHTLKLQAIVRRTNADASQYGLEFIHISEADQVLIDYFLYQGMYEQAAGE